MKQDRIVAFLIAGALALMVAGCQSQPVTGPSVAASEAPDGFTLFATATPTSLPTDTPTATATATPTPTETPLPTATPLAASAAGRAPVGRVVFGVTRGDAPAEQLWLLDETGETTILADSVAPGGWECSPARQDNCALITTDGYLLAANPISRTTALLDQLDVTDVASTTVAGADAMRLPLALSPDGRSLAVAHADKLDLYDLSSPALQASIAVTGVSELVWSPDGETLALVYPVKDASALALWGGDAGKLKVIAQMDSVQHTVWAPDSEKIAFDAYQSPATPSSQGDRKDVFVVFLRSGEIANFSEVFQRNLGVAAADRIAAWSPQWQSADVLRYMRGVPDAPDTYALMSHPVKSRRATQLWLADDEGLLGIHRSPDGTLDARVMPVDDRMVVQVSPVAGREWTDLPGAYDRLDAIAWAPVAGDDEASRYLLLVQDQTMLAVDVESGAIQGLALSCPECRIAEATWLP